MTEQDKIKITSADIIVWGTCNKPYFAIKYLEVGSDKYCIGYGSYDLKEVFQWLKEAFDIQLDKEKYELTNGVLAADDREYEKADVEHKLKIALSQLRDNCWSCKNAGEYNFPGTRLRTCEYMRERGVVASNRSTNCEHWEWNHGKEHKNE